MAPCLFMAVLTLLPSAWVKQGQASSDPVAALRSAVTASEVDVEQLKKAVDGAVIAGLPAALPVLAEAIGQFEEKLQSAAAELARAEKALDLVTAAGASEEIQKDHRVTREKSQLATTKQRAALDAADKGLDDLLDAVTGKAAANALSALVEIYQKQHDRIGAVEKEDEERKGKLALLSSKVFELEGQKAPAEDLKPMALDKAEFQARVDCSTEALARHRRLKLHAATATGALLAAGKGPEVEQTLKSVEKKVDSRAPPADRITWIDLYARLGRETVPTELWDVALSAGKQAKKLDDELTKQREKYEKAREALFNSIDPKTNTVNAASQNAYNQLEKDLQKLAEDQRTMEKLRTTAAGAVGPAVAALPEEKREKATNWVLGIAKGSGELEARCALLESLGAFDSLSVREALRRLLVEDKETKARLAALEALVALKDADAMEVARVRFLAHANWRVRAAAVSALLRVPQKESIPALITTLDAEVGRLREDVTQALQRLTGQHFAMSALPWQKWWEANEATFKIEDVQAAPKLAVSAWDEAGRDKVTFYGISSVSRKVCFVLDVSKSMEQPTVAHGEKRKIDTAKEQLKQAVTGLNDGDMFMIVYFAGTAARWAQKMTKVDAGVRSRVTHWIDDTLEMGPGTNIYDGMKEAFAAAGLGARDPNYESGIDTIFFLSDGDATVGDVTDPFELRKLIRDWNRLSRIRIHTIGVGEEPNIALLYGIAEDSGGQFQHR